MIKELNRSLLGIYTPSNTTITFTSNPYLSVGNELLITYAANDLRISDTVTSVLAGNTIGVTYNNPYLANNNTNVLTPWYGVGMTGPQAPFSYNTSTTPSTIIQGISLTNGAYANTSNVKLEVSTDLSVGGWINIANITPSVANSNTSYVFSNMPWPYARLNILDIAANSTIKFNRAS